MLLLLRVLLAMLLCIQGSFYLRGPSPDAATWSVGLAAILAGGLLLCGIFTPLIAFVVILGALGIWSSALPASTPTLFAAVLTDILGIALLLAVGVLGPGAFSVDARLFGRREIVIPPARSRGALSNTRSS